MSGHAPGFFVRRAKALFFSGCENPPGKFRSDRYQIEHGKGDKAMPPDLKKLLPEAGAQ